MKRLIIHIFIFLTCAQSFPAQESKPVLIDGFDRISCSDLRGRLDNFLLDLFQHPKLVGYVVLSSEADYLQVFRRRRLVENHMIYRKFDRNRVIFLRRKGMPAIGIELWNGQADSKMDFEVETQWPYSVPTGTKPFVLVTGGYDESECALPSDEELLSNFLIANPGSRSNIVIRCKGRNCFPEMRSRIVLEMTKTYGISRNRLNFFYIPIQTDYYVYEYWLLP